MDHSFGAGCRRLIVELDFFNFFNIPACLLLRVFTHVDLARIESDHGGTFACFTLLMVMKIEGATLAF